MTERELRVPLQVYRLRVFGLGLGRSICHSLAAANGGRVGAGPHPAGGARFFVEVPAAPAAAAV